MFFEEKVVCTSTPQNQVFQNKNAMVGYALVAEFWDDTLNIGSVQHFFTTPDNYTQHIGLGTSPTLNNQGIETSYLAGKSCLLDNSSCKKLDGHSFIALPPQLDFPDSLKSWNWLLGVEYQTLTQNGDSQPVQSKSYKFSVAYGREDLPNSLKYIKSVMYQTNYPGSFWQNYIYRLILSYKPFHESSGNGTSYINELIFFLIDLMNGTIGPHPFKRINRNYQVADYRLSTSILRLDTAQVVDIYTPELESSTLTINTYENLFNSIPRSTKNVFSDGIETRTENLFITDSLSAEIGYFSSAAVNHLKDIGYKMPVGSKSFLFENLIGLSLTALDTVDNIVVPASNWTARNGEVCLAGKFITYNEDGKPTSYRLAKHETDENSPVDSLHFFDQILLEWDPQLHLIHRSYKGFATNYSYNEYFELDSIADPDNIRTSYAYDLRGRLSATWALNDRQISTHSYQIEPGGNYVRTELSFEDSSFPPQITTQYLDGFGRPLSTIRENDGALLSNTTYDSYFREAGRFNITTGPSIISYDASPITRKTILTDAVGNVTETLKTGDPDFFSATKVRDPNGHTSTTYANSLGLTAKTLSGEGSATTYHYDDLARLVLIVNPVGEEFSYEYNDIGRVYEKRSPGAGPSPSGGTRPSGPQQ